MFVFIKYFNRINFSLSRYYSFCAFYEQDFRLCTFESDRLPYMDGAYIVIQLDDFLSPPCSAIPHLRGCASDTTIADK